MLRSLGALDLSIGVRRISQAIANEVKRQHRNNNGDGRDSSQGEMASDWMFGHPAAARPN
jgi:hypothetical protein